jgi:hypothetical protein
MSELLSIRFFAVEWNAWATLRVSRSSPVIVITEKLGSSDFRALQISSRRTLRASLQDQTMVRVRMSLIERRWSFSACGRNTHCAQSLGRGHWLQPLGSIYENDLTHSNAAKVAGSRSLQAPCDRTVDFAQHPEKPMIPRSVRRRRSA